MPSAIPAPLPPWAKVLLQVVPYVTAYVIGLLEHSGDITPGEAGTTPDEWRLCQLVVDNMSSTLERDNALCTFEFANITGGTIDSTWTDQDYVDAEAAVASITGGWLNHMSAAWQTREMRWYRRAFNPYSVTKPFMDSGPPVRVTPFAHYGNVGGYMPAQVAFSVTEKTAFPKNWGRFYLPGLSSNEVDSSLQCGTAVVDGVANAVEAAYATAMGKEIFPVVPTTQVGKVPARGLLTVSAVQVDSIADVIRRRRASSPLHKRSLPVVAAQQPAV